MPGAPSAELIACEEGSDEQLMFYGVMEELASLCCKEFACFKVIGYTKQVVNGTIYQGKIQVADEGDTPFVHVKILQHLPHTGKQPEIQFFKNNQVESAAFDF